MLLPLRKLLLYFFSLMIFASFFNQKMMTRTEYNQVQIGSSSNVVKEIAGSPYKVVKNKDGSETYLYLERHEIAPGTIDQITYKIKIENGKVVDKQESTSAKSIDIRYN